MQDFYTKFTHRMNLYFHLIRLNKPTGFFLLLWPAVFAVFMATHFDHNYTLLFKFIIGAFLMRSAGCIINDLIDIEFDKQVKRTKSRPLAAGLISKKEAMQVLFCLLCLSLLLLTTFKFKTVLYGIFFIIPVVIYPYMKRITFFPQVFLGFTFNLSVILAYIESQGYIGLNGFIIYFALSLWTMSYDTIYGFMDKEDDIKIGVKSTSILLGNNFYIYMEFMNVLICLLLVLAGLQIQAHFIYFLTVIMTYAIFIWQKSRLDINDPQSCELVFRSNIIVGILLLIGSMNA